MVHRDEQQVLAFLNPEEDRSQQRAVGEIERLLSGSAGQPERLSLAISDRRGGHLAHLERLVARCRDNLYRHAAVRGEGRAQRLVTPDNLVERKAERRDIERAGQAKASRRVVRRAGLELLDEPEPLLRERQRRLAVSRHGPERRNRWRFRLLRGRETFGERGDGRRLEDGAQRQANSQRLAKPGNGLRRRQRIAAEREEVRMTIDRRMRKEIAPDLGYRLLNRRRGQVDRRRRRARRRTGEAPLGHRVDDVLDRPQVGGDPSQRLGRRRR